MDKVFVFVVLMTFILTEALDGFVAWTNVKLEKSSSHSSCKLIGQMNELSIGTCTTVNIILSRCS